jgi:aryl sulfotransferase
MPNSDAHPAGTRRIIQNHHMDSTRWDDFPLRSDDIVIATYAKAGTTWLQQIVGQLVLKGEPMLCSALSPWLDMRLAPKEEVFAQLEAQTHRRFIKTHLPVDALPWSPDVKYLYVARDVRDLIWSLHRFHSDMTPLFLDLLNNTPGRVGPEIAPADPDIVAYYRTFLETDAYPFWAFWSHVQGWWEMRDRPNVRLIHFNDLKADMEGQIRSLADWLGIAIDPETWPAIVAHSSFDWMRQASEAAPPSMINELFGDGMTALVHKGTNGRWKDVLSPQDVALADEMAEKHLSPDCAAWLRQGAMALADERL